MTKNQENEEDWGMDDFVNVSPAKKKKKKRQHADKEAGKVCFLDERHYVNFNKDGPHSLSDKRNLKKKAHTEAKVQESSMDVEIEHSNSEYESHHIRSKQKSAKNKVPCNATHLHVKMMKRTVEERNGNELEGNIDDAVNENDLHGIRDECFFHVKKHGKSKRKSYSSVMEDTSANASEDFAANTLEESSKIEKRHKKRKDKPKTLGVLSVSETGELDDLDSNNLGMLIKKEGCAEKECHPEKKRKKNQKVAKAKYVMAEHVQTESVVSNWEITEEQGFFGQTKHSTEPSNLEDFLKVKKAHKSSKHRKNAETVEVHLSTHSEACIAERDPLSEDLSDEQSFAQVTHGSAHKERKRKKQSMVEQTVSAADERSGETESMADDPPDAVEELMFGDEHSYETALAVLETFVPKVRTMNQYTVKSLLKYDLRRFLTFKEQGIPIRYGRFSTEENEQLQENMKAYLDLTGIDSADKVLHPFRYPEETKALMEAKRRYVWQHYIAIGIPRPVSQVKGRAQKMFDPYNYKGRYSAEETEELRRHQATCGNKWSEISNRMARSNHSVALKFSQLRNPINNKGSWSKAEMKRLVQAVQHYLQNTQSHNELENVASTMVERSSGEVMSLVRDKLYKGISWIQVEANVGTRNWMQCKLKWNSFLTKKMNRGVKVRYRGDDALLTKIRLIERLYESHVEDSSDLNWEDLAESIGNVPPAYVQNKFYNLKARYVPSWHKKTFTEIVDYLHDEVLPKFEIKLKRNKTDEETVHNEQQRVYRFADIFQDSDLDGSDSEDQ